MKRAAIYVRTSSEHQGAKSSPDEQEADCRKLADEQGLIVEAVYRDIERYRAKNRLVDPSGTRADRPGLVAMMEDAAAGRFDVILAWREDRLYRGLRAMLFVLETIQEHKIGILLAKESFDEKMAPLKAWLAQMELEGMRERMTMGVKARLRSGKANTGQDRYGYKRNGESIGIVEEEARWVRQIFDWYLQGVYRLEIRRRLIEAGAPQKGGTKPIKIIWSRGIIDGILKGAKDYAFGMKTQSRDGEKFEIPIPPILTPEIYQQFMKIRDANKSHPVRNVKHNYLIGGLLYCSCNHKWGARGSQNWRRNRRGEMVQRKTRNWVYFCPESHKEHINPDCPRSIGAKKADEIVWRKVCDAINNPEVLLGDARLHIAEIRHKAGTILSDRDGIQRELDALTMERQKVIFWGRKEIITEADMEHQLMELTLMEMNYKRELSKYSEIIDLTALGDWEQAAREYFLDLRVGIESLDFDPASEEEEQEIFEYKKGIIKALVYRVTIDKRRELKVDVRLNLLDILKQAAGGEVTSFQQVGTYTHIPANRARRHRSAGGG
jgi:site-specific DNA recombinase